MLPRVLAGRVVAVHVSSLHSFPGTATSALRLRRCLGTSFMSDASTPPRQTADAAFRGTNHGKSGAGGRIEPSGRRVERLHICESMKHNLFGIGVARLSEIQMKAFAGILRGNSFVGRSRTGTGKTLAYLLPIVERILQEKMTAPASVLILVPTQELCKQIGTAILSLSATTNVALVYGGPSLGSQEQLVRTGALIVVATPGRCARLIERGAIEPQNVRCIIVDEADAMLGLAFLGRVERIFAAVAKPNLQGIFFSASMPPEIRAVIGRHFIEHEFVDVVDRGGARNTSTVEAVSHSICLVPDEHNQRMRVLLHLLANKMDELGGRSIIFVDSTSEANNVVTHPMLDRKARALHKESTAEDRDIVLTAFASGEFDVLVATDTISRGVDFSDVNLVLQLHPPRDASNYVHRSGRTGRAGRGGTCIMLYDRKEHMLVRRVRELTRQSFRKEPTPGPEDIHHAAVSRLLDELLAVQTDEFEPCLADAQKLLDEQGPRVLATAMAVLDSRHADLSSEARDIPSILSGRLGYKCFIAHDPEFTIAETPDDVIRILRSLLPQRAEERCIGKVAYVQGGWAVDISHRWAAVLTFGLRSGRISAPFELKVPDQMPRFLHRSGRSHLRMRRLPWQSLRRAAIRRGKESGAKLDKKGPRYDGRWPGKRR